MADAPAPDTAVPTATPTTGREDAGIDTSLPGRPSVDAVTDQILARFSSFVGKLQETNSAEGWTLRDDNVIAFPRFEQRSLRSDTRVQLAAEVELKAWINDFSDPIFTTVSDTFAVAKDGDEPWITRTMEVEHRLETAKVPVRKTQIMATFDTAVGFHAQRADVQVIRVTQETSASIDDVRMVSDSAFLGVSDGEFEARSGGDVHREVFEDLVAFDRTKPVTVYRACRTGGGDVISEIKVVLDPTEDAELYGALTEADSIIPTARDLRLARAYNAAR